MALIRARKTDEAGASPGGAARGGLADLAAKAWTLAVARAGQEELGVSVDLRAVSVERRSLAEFLELLPEPALIAVLDEGSGEATGVAVLDAALMSGMVEALTTGAVTAGSGGARRPTRTDAALLAPVLDRALAGFDAALAEVEGADARPRGYRFAASAEGARALSLLLEEGPYRLLRAECVLAGGARQGALLLGLPDRRAGGPPRAEVLRDDRFSADLARQVEASQVRLEAVLIRLMLPLGQMMALVPGMEQPLPQADIRRIGLEGMDGRPLAEGRLGRQGALRAIRLIAEDAAGTSLLIGAQGDTGTAQRIAPARDAGPPALREGRRG